MIIVEACVNSAASALEAKKGGAHRVELCDNLYEGGTTPGPATIMFVSKIEGIDLHVLIRPRGGDFLYTEIEFSIMQQDIDFCKQNGVKGVVLGLLREDGSIDVERTTVLVKRAHPMNVTFHRAFDMVTEPFQALEDVIATGCNRILTSGLQNKAWEGREMIKSLVQAAESRIILMAGSGVNAENAEKLVQHTGVSEIHTSSRTSHSSKMQFKRSNVFMGGLAEIPEYEIGITDSTKIKLILQSVNGNFFNE
jgi:copper homeostasis protein